MSKNSARERETGQRSRASRSAAADSRSGRSSSRSRAPSAFNASARQIAVPLAGALAPETQPAVDRTPGRRPATHEARTRDAPARDAISRDAAGRGPASSRRGSQVHAAGSRVEGTRAALSEPQSDPGWTFYLGTHEVSWLTNEIGPLFISHRRLALRKSLPRAATRWALDSGGFSELELHGRWVTTPTEYIDATRQYATDIGMLDWAAPMDWMCEPKMLARTGLTVEDHQRRTIANFLELRERAPELPYIPVIQGWTRADYERCVTLYEAAGVNLSREARVGVGSVCRRQGTPEVAEIIWTLADAGLSLHGFGVKARGIANVAGALTSADSMAWSYRARRDKPLPGCQHQRCSNCIRYAERWRTRLLAQVYPQLRLNLGG
jgi:hypothetical protein